MEGRFSFLAGLNWKEEKIMKIMRDIEMLEDSIVEIQVPNSISFSGRLQKHCLSEIRSNLIQYNISSNV